MAYIFLNAGVYVNGVNLSSYVSEVSVDMTLAAVEVTAMGAGGKQFIQGLEDSKIDLTFWNDFNVGTVNATLQAVRATGTLVPIKIYAGGSPASTVAPLYSGSAIMTDFPILVGKVGDALSSKATFQVSGTLTQAFTG